MNPSENKQWQTLVALSASTFDGEMMPPYGFTTHTLARLKAERKEQDLLERIGLRAIFASLTVLVIAAGMTFVLQSKEVNDFDPGVRSLAAMESVQPF